MPNKAPLSINTKNEQPADFLNSNLFFRTLKPTPVVGFRFLSFIGDNSGDIMKDVERYNYKKARICYGKQKWFIYYSFRVPENMRPEYNDRRWLRFKIYEDINVIKTRDYAQLLLKCVNRALDSGYSPFNPTPEKFEVVKTWDVVQAFNFFFQKWEQRGNAISTTKKYKYVINHFMIWCRLNNYLYAPVNSVTRKLIENYLEQSSAKYKWSNRYYNDTMLFLRTIFKFLIKEDIISKNPCSDIDKKKFITKKHAYFDDKKFAEVRKLMKENDPLLFFAASIVYYMCVRSEKELRYLRLDNIYPERKLALIKAAESKTGMDRLVPISDELIAEFKILKENYPENYYVIGVSHHNKFIAENVPSDKPFGNGFLSKRFVKIRKLAGLSSDFTLYGMRHTRAIHLKLDGARDEEIMRLFGHTDFITTSKYLRDLGISVDGSRINELSRKF